MLTGSLSASLAPWPGHPAVASAPFVAVAVGAGAGAGAGVAPALASAPSTATGNTVWTRLSVRVAMNDMQVRSMRDPFDPLDACLTKS